MTQVVDKLKVGSTGEIVSIVDSASDYTAFEVLAHSEDIPKGASELLGGSTNKVIPASMEHRFCIRTTELDRKNSDVVVDWCAGGPEGKTGEIGDPGDVYFDELTEEQKEQLRGLPGKTPEIKSVETKDLDPDDSGFADITGDVETG